MDIAQHASARAVQRAEPPNTLDVARDEPSTDREPDEARAILRCGTQVVSSDLQRVGYVRRLLTDTHTLLPTHMIVSPSRYARSHFTIPVSSIERLLAGEVYLSLSFEQITRTCLSPKVPHGGGDGTGTVCI
jgi:hypothetical protein